MATNNKIIQSGQPSKRISRSLSHLDVSTAPTFNKSDCEGQAFHGGSITPKDDSGVCHTQLSVSIQDITSVSTSLQYDIDSTRRSSSCGVDADGYTPMAKGELNDHDDPTYESICDSTISVNPILIVAEDTSPGTPDLQECETNRQAQTKLRPQLPLRSVILEKHSPAPAKSLEVDCVLDEAKALDKKEDQCVSEQDVYDTVADQQNKTCTNIKLILGIMVVSVVVSMGVAFPALAISLNTSTQLTDIKIENAALRTQLNLTRQVQEISLAEEDLNLLREIVRQKVQEELEPVISRLEQWENMTNSLWNEFRVQHNLSLQVSNAQDARLVKLEGSAKLFENETKQSFTELSDQVMESHQQIEQLSLNFTRISDELDENQRKIDHLTSELNVTRTNLTSSIETTRDDFRRDLHQLQQSVHSELSETQDILINQFDNLREKFNAFESETTQAIDLLSKSLNDTESDVIELRVDFTNHTGVFNEKIMEIKENHFNLWSHVNESNTATHDQLNNLMQRVTDNFWYLTTELNATQVDFNSRVLNLTSETHEEFDQLRGEINSTNTQLELQIAKQKLDLESLEKAFTNHQSVFNETLTNVRTTFVEINNRFNETETELREEFDHFSLETRNNITSLSVHVERANTMLSNRVTENHASITSLDTVTRQNDARLEMSIDRLRVELTQNLRNQDSSLRVFSEAVQEINTRVGSLEQSFPIVQRLALTLQQDLQRVESRTDRQIGNLYHRVTVLHTSSAMTVTFDSLTFTFTLIASVLISTVVL